MDSLSHRGQPFQPHPGIDTWLGQRVEGTGCVTVVLHEDQIPDLNDSVALAVRSIIARNNRALIEMDLGTGAAGTGVRHLPEVILLIASRNARGRHADLSPQPIRFIVFSKDRHPKPIFGESDGVRQKLPPKHNRVFFEIISERKVPQHLKEGVMAPGIPDILKIVMLTPRTQTLLHRHRPRIGACVLPKEHSLELIHPGIGKQQGRIGLRQKRGARHGLMSMLFEIPDKSSPQLGCTIRLHGQRPHFS